MPAEKANQQGCNRKIKHVTSRRQSAFGKEEG
jgi:hypothetical protein